MKTTSCEDRLLQNRWGRRPECGQKQKHFVGIRPALAEIDDEILKLDFFGAFCFSCSASKIGNDQEKFMALLLVGIQPEMPHIIENGP